LFGNFEKEPTCTAYVKEIQHRLSECHGRRVFLTAIIQPGKAKFHAIDKPLNLNSKSRNAICLAAAFCFKQYNQQLNDAHNRLSLLLLNSGAKAITTERYAHQGITMPHVSAIKMQTKAVQTSSKCTSWKQDTLEKELKIRIVQEVISNSHSIAPLDLSKDIVSHMKYYEEMHGDIVALVHSVHGKEGTVSAPDNFNCNDPEDAVTELRKSTFHYK